MFFIHDHERGPVCVKLHDVVACARSRVVVSALGELESAFDVGRSDCAAVFEVPVLVKPEQPSVSAFGE